MSSAYFKREMKKRNIINNDSLRKKYLKKDSRYFYILLKDIYFVLVRNN